MNIREDEFSLYIEDLDVRFPYQQESRVYNRAEMSVLQSVWSDGQEVIARYDTDPALSSADDTWQLESRYDGEEMYHTVVGLNGDIVCSDITDEFGQFWENNKS